MTQRATRSRPSRLQYRSGEARVWSAHGLAASAREGTILLEIPLDGRIVAAPDQGANPGSAQPTASAR